MAPGRIVVGIIFILLSSHTLAFVVHKRSTYNLDTERGELKDALKLLERQRRRLDDIDDNLPLQEWWPRAGLDDDIPSDIDESKYLPGAEEYLQSLLPSRIREGYDDNENVIPQEEDNKAPPVPVDLNELEDALEASDAPEKKSEAKREAAPGVDLTMEAKDDDTPAVKKENKVEQLDPDLVKKLLAEADKVEVEKLEKLSKGQKVSKDELKSVLGDDNNEKGKSRKRDEFEDKQGEMQTFLYPSKTAGDIKRKRSGPQILDNADSSNLVDIKFVKDLIRLEDQENSNLAQALNYATLAQLDKTSKYLPKEIEYLRKAIANEAELQAVIGEISSDENDSENINDESEIYAKKRFNLEAHRPGLEELSPEDREKAVILSYLLKRGAPTEGFDPRDLPEDAVVDDTEWSTDPVRDFREAEGLPEEEMPLDRKVYRKRGDGDIEDDDVVEDEGVSPAEAEGVLRAYLQRMPASDRKQLKQAVEDEIQQIEDANRDVERGEDEGLDGGQCPAADYLVQGCPLQKQENIDLDDEALDLCNRHALCYTCGAVHGLSADDCDSGYMNEASLDCDPDDNQCNDGITALYIMFLQHHRYIPASATEEICADSCVLDSVTGAAKKKKKK